ncbi:MAG: hypothetical protein GY793_08410 [Proteobacteria bacterium]|nr:hypothetical protein [Pseudomonadota bacterium]
MEKIKFVVINLNGNPKQQARVENVSALELKLICDIHGKESIFQVGSVKEMKGSLTFSAEMERLRAKYGDIRIDKFVKDYHIKESFKEKINVSDFISAINNKSSDEELEKVKTQLANMKQENEKLKAKGTANAS